VTTSPGCNRSERTGMVTVLFSKNLFCFAAPKVNMKFHFDFKKTSGARRRGIKQHLFCPSP